MVGVLERSKIDQHTGLTKESKGIKINLRGRVGSTGEEAARLQVEVPLTS